MSRKCKYYFDNIKYNPEMVSDECKARKGIYADDEITDHFWKSGKGHATTCKHCTKIKRSEVAVYDPKILPGWPQDENGRYLNYWRLFDE